MSYGKRVIGEQAWKTQEAAATAARDRGLNFGSRVTGPATAVAEAPSEKVADETTADKVTTSDKGASDEKDVEGKSKAPTSLSLNELDVALEENATVEFFDEMVDAEFSRVEGPRKGGLRLLLKAEQDRDEVPPRAAIMTELTKALKV